MTVTFTVLTVCQGNVHRSVLAAALLRQWAHWYSPASEHIRVGSAGLAAQEGMPASSRITSLIEHFGVTPSTHHARSVTEQMLTESDLILTATTRQRTEVVQRAPSALMRTFTIREAGRTARQLDAVPTPSADVAELRDVVARLAANRMTSAEEDDIVDPHRQGNDAYFQVAGDEVPPLAHLAHLLLGMPPADVAEYERVAAETAALTQVAS